MSAVSSLTVVRPVSPNTVSAFCQLRNPLVKLWLGQWFSPEREQDDLAGALQGLLHSILAWSSATDVSRFFPSLVIWLSPELLGDI